MAGENRSPIERALRRVVTDYGRRIGEQSERVRALLSDSADEHGRTHRAELDAVVVAAEEGVPAALLQRGPAGITDSNDELVSRLTARGLDTSLAEIAVRDWIHALGVAGSAAVPQPVNGAPSTEPPVATLQPPSPRPSSPPPGAEQPRPARPVIAGPTELVPPLLAPTPTPAPASAAPSSIYTSAGARSTRRNLRVIAAIAAAVLLVIGAGAIWGLTRDEPATAADDRGPQAPAVPTPTVPPTPNDPPAPTFTPPVVTTTAPPPPPAKPFWQPAKAIRPLTFDAGQAKSAAGTRAQNTVTASKITTGTTTWGARYVGRSFLATYYPDHADALPDSVYVYQYGTRAAAAADMLTWRGQTGTTRIFNESNLAIVDTTTVKIDGKDRKTIRARAVIRYASAEVYAACWSTPAHKVSSAALMGCAERLATRQMSAVKYLFLGAP